MALSSAQKLKVVTLLGWPAKTLTVGDLSYSKIISDRLEIDADTQDLVEEYLDKIANLDTALDTARGRGGVKRIDEIEFFGSDQSGSSELKVIHKERSRLLRELSRLIEIPMGLGCGSMVNVSI